MSHNLPSSDVIRRSSAWTWNWDLAPWALNADYVIGLAIAALAPAVFWPLAIKLAGFAFGFSVSWTALLAVGSGVFAFLATIYTLIARNR